MIIAPEKPRIYTHVADPRNVVVPHDLRIALLVAAGLIRCPISGGALVVPNIGEEVGLSLFLKDGVYAVDDLDIRLYTSNTTPGETDTFATYTEMTAVQSYALVGFTGASWVVTPGNPTTAAYPQITWTFSAGGPTSVYGYFVTERTSPFRLRWAERFTGAPFVVQNTNDQILITPQITLE